MGDENSLQGRTQAHKHEAPSSTGGFLETGVTGVTNLSNGSMVYGDASEKVTELTSGNLNDVLTMGATLPQWTASSSGSYFEFLGSTTAVSTSPITVSFAAVSSPSFVVAQFEGTPAGGQEVGFQVNGLTASNYNNQGFYQKAGSQTLRNVSANDKFYGIDSGISGNGVAYAKFFINTIDENIYMSSESYTDSGGGAGGYSSFGGNYSNGAITSITSITCLGNPFDGTLSCWAVRN